MQHINLMSLQAQRRECVRTRLRQWIYILAVVVVALGLLTLERYFGYRGATQQQLALEAAYDPISELKTANKLLTKQIAAIRSEKEFVLALSEQEPTITLLGLLGKAVADGNERVFLQKIELNNLGLASGSPTQKSTVLDLAGIANTGTAVNQFVETLQSVVPFGKIGITTSKEYRIKQQTMQDFSLQCNF
jgi:Tfp pilus assembly protein PilN